MSTAPQFPSDYRPHGPREVVRTPRDRRATRKKVLAWIGGGIAALVLLIFIVVYVALHSRAVHGYILRVSQEKATTTLGAKVTLRGDRMYEFVDRLVTIALPRVKDFRGLNPKSFDGRGNYSLGLREQVIFPEINLEKVDKVKGMTIVICTTARTDADGKALLRALGMPFRV